MIILKIVNFKTLLRYNSLLWNVFHSFVVIIENINLEIIDSMHFQTCLHFIWKVTLKYIIYNVCSACFRKEFEEAFLKQLSASLGQYSWDAVGGPSPLVQNIWEESIYSVAIFFNVANQVHCFQKEPPLREKRYLHVCGPTYLRANLSPWGGCVRLWQDLCLETVKLWLCRITPYKIWR